MAWQCAQQLWQVYHQSDPAAGRRLANKIIDSLPSCPMLEIGRLGKTLRRWRAVFLAYFATAGASNGGTEAINGLIKLHGRIARGFRNREHYRLRMLSIGGGLTPPQVGKPMLWNRLHVAAAWRKERGIQLGRDAKWGQPDTQAASTSQHVATRRPFNCTQLHSQLAIDESDA